MHACMHACSKTKMRPSRRHSQTIRSPSHTLSCGGSIASLACRPWHRPIMIRHPHKTTTTRFCSSCCLLYLHIIMGGTRCVLSECHSSSSSKQQRKQQLVGWLVIGHPTISGVVEKCHSDARRTGEWLSKGVFTPTSTLRRASQLSGRLRSLGPRCTCGSQQ